MSQNDERMFSMLIYLISFFAPLIGPLLVWLIKRDESRFIDFHGKQYFNFLISYTIYGIACSIWIIMFAIGTAIASIMFIGLVLGFILAAAIGILGFIFTIIALIKAYGGKQFRIPFTIPLIR